jgi:hypothetical protein
MMAVRRSSERDPARMKYADHQALWRLVEGAVMDAFANHPDYLTDAGRHMAVQSITKRVVGQIIGRAAEALKRGPLGASCREVSLEAFSGADTCLVSASLTPLQAGVAP